MAGNINNAKKYACKYIVDNLVLMLGSETLSLDFTNILAIEYLNDYEFNIRAMLKVKLRVDIRRKLWILNNKRNISAKFELSKIGMDIESESFITSPEVVWNNEFSLYLNDDEEATDTKVMEERINLNEGSEYSYGDISQENYFETQNIIDIYLFDQKFLNASANTYNEVFTKDILQNCVARLLTATNHRNVLMSKFENDEVYEELLVPALPSYKALIYLDQYYGFYKTGAMIYYDIDSTYILNTNGKITAKRLGEWITTCIYVTALDNSQPGNGMMRISGQNINYVSINEMNINPQKPSISKNSVIGSEAKFVVSDDVTINITDANQSYVDQRNETIAYTKKGDNKFITEIAKARMEENECILYISAENLDITAFTPNKEYQLVFDETSKQEKYGKQKYRLAYAYHCIAARSGEYMDASHQIVLKKIASGEEVTE